jgi:hypothetical protein
MMCRIYLARAPIVPGHTSRDWHRLDFQFAGLVSDNAITGKRIGCDPAFSDAVHAAGAVYGEEGNEAYKAGTHEDVADDLQAHVRDGRGVHGESGNGAECGEDIDP